MLRRLAGRHVGSVAGIFALTGFLAAIVLMPREWRGTLRETAFDAVLAFDLQIRHSNGDSFSVVVVDIDRRSLDFVGPWPWPRDAMARLVEAVARAKPAVIAIDILFAEPDSNSPAALARRLGALTNNNTISGLAAALPDGDKRLASAIKMRPTVLGFVLDPDPVGTIASVPIMVRNRVAIDEVWRLGGALGPQPPLVEAASGLGALSLPSDADGTARRVPMLVGVGDALRPGLALETIRLSRQASTYLIEPDPQSLLVGDLKIPLPRDGLLRLSPFDPREHDARTIPAIDVIEGKAKTSQLAGSVVLIGGSAPELGGLRKTATDPLTPSVQIQADAIRQMAARRVPHNNSTAAENSLILGIGVASLAAAAMLSPLFATILVFAVIAAAWAGAVLLSLNADLLLDPITPSIGGLVAFATTSVGSYALVRRREARIRRRFEQHLAPAVVRRIAEEPGILRLRGERREVTALFTDIEGFTAMTHRASPEQLVGVLDAYIEGVAGIVMAHGGMVDKIVGDAVHALFNAPVDLERHPQKAVDCAIAIHAWANTYRSRPGPSEIGFGRTRVGIETGPAIVGDIGIQSKLDYTAHGDAINSAARLEAANKELGSTICVGPTTASRCERSIFRPLGLIALRGIDEPIAAFEPWPDDWPIAWRERYLAAWRLVEVDPDRAADLFDALGADCSNDPVPRLLAARLRSRHAL